MTVDPHSGQVTLTLGNTLGFSIAGGPTAPRAAREEFLDRLGPRLDQQTVECAQLLLSELVSNCVEHGAARGEEVSVHVMAALLPDTLRVSVTDGGIAFRHIPRFNPSEFATGQGLWLVAEMSARWGISDVGPARVWFELPR